MALTFDQRQARQKGIGGSDAGPICGMSPYADASALSVYYSKTEEVEQVEEPYEWQLWGNILEPIVRQHYCNQTGFIVEMPKQLFVHPEHSWMVGNLDGIAKDPEGVYPDRGYEGKIDRFGKGWGPSGSDEIPEHILLQVQHYMAVTGLEQFDVAVLIGNSDYRQYTIPADAEIQRYLIDIEREFWFEHVLKRVPPAPVNLSDARKRWGQVLYRNMVEADEACAEAWQELMTLKKQIKELETAKEKQELILQSAIAGHEGLLLDGKPIVTWKNNRDSEWVDYKAMIAAHPELAKQYTHTVRGARVFLPKAPAKPKKKK